MRLTDMIIPRGTLDSIGTSRAPATPSETLESEIKQLIGTPQRVGETVSSTKNSGAVVFRQRVVFHDSTAGAVYVAVGHIGSTPSGYVSYSRECPELRARGASGVGASADALVPAVKRADIVSAATQAPLTRDQLLLRMLAEALEAPVAARTDDVSRSIRQIEGQPVKVGKVPYGKASGSTVFKGTATFEDGTTGDFYVKLGWFEQIPSGSCGFSRQAPQNMIAEITQGSPTLGA